MLWIVDGTPQMTPGWAAMSMMPAGTSRPSTQWPAKVASGRPWSAQLPRRSPSRLLARPQSAPGPQARSTEDPAHPAHPVRGSAFSLRQRAKGALVLDSGAEWNETRAFSAGRLVLGRPESPVLTQKRTSSRPRRPSGSAPSRPNRRLSVRSLAARPLQRAQRAADVLAGVIQRSIAAEVCTRTYWPTPHFSRRPQTEVEEPPEPEEAVKPRDLAALLKGVFTQDLRTEASDAPEGQLQGNKPSNSWYMGVTFGDNAHMTNKLQVPGGSPDKPSRRRDTQHWPTSHGQVRRPVAGEWKHKHGLSGTAPIAVEQGSRRPPVQRVRRHSAVGSASATPGQAPAHVPSQRMRRHSSTGATSSPVMRAASSRGYDDKSPPRPTMPADSSHRSHPCRMSQHVSPPIT